MGSSSVKYGLFEGKKELISGIEGHIGLKDGCSTHEIAIRKILSMLKAKKYISSLKEIKGVGHRVVHGGKLSKSVVINARIKKLIHEMIPVAPLHNAPELKGIVIAQKLLDCKHVAVFDTAFHQTLPEKA